MQFQRRNTSRKAMKVICTQACVILLPLATVIFARCASDIATPLQLWVGHPHPNEHSFRAFLYTVCAYSKTEHEPQRRREKRTPSLTKSTSERTSLDSFRPRTSGIRRGLYLSMRVLSVVPRYAVTVGSLKVTQRGNGDRENT